MTSEGRLFCICRLPPMGFMPVFMPGMGFIPPIPFMPGIFVIPVGKRVSPAVQGWFQSVVPLVTSPAQFCRCS